MRERLAEQLRLGRPRSCENTVGSFKCQCQNGWYGDGFNPIGTEGFTPAEWGCLEADYCPEAQGYLGCHDINNCEIGRASCRERV